MEKWISILKSNELPKRVEVRGKCILLKVSRDHRDLAVRTDQESDNERLASETHIAYSQ